VGGIWCVLRQEGINYQDCWRKIVAIHSSGQTVFGFSHIEGIMLDACEDRIGDRSSKVQATGMYGEVSGKGGTRRTGC
jgi:hypothetical protein